MANKPTLKKGNLAIFAKTPIAGKVKTRLIPQLGAHQANLIYQKLLKQTLSVANQLNTIKPTLWIDGNLNHPICLGLKKRHGWRLRQQHGHELGARMSHAIRQGLSHCEYVILIGSDCPYLTSSELSSAVTYLATGYDAVIGPSADGGYYLIGLKQHYHYLFTQIPWSTDTVAELTCRRMQQHHLKYAKLKTLIDIDNTKALSSWLFQRNTISLP